MAINLTFFGSRIFRHLSCWSSILPEILWEKVLRECRQFRRLLSRSSVGLYATLDVDLEESVQFVMHLASKVHGKFLGPLNPSFDQGRSIRNIFMRNLPKDAYKRACGKMHISLTRVSDWKNIVVSEYDSNEDLVDVSSKRVFFHFSFLLARGSCLIFKNSTFKS